MTSPQNTAKTAMSILGTRVKWHFDKFVTKIGHEEQVSICDDTLALLTQISETIKATHDEATMLELSNRDVVDAYNALSMLNHSVTGLNGISDVEDPRGARFSAWKDLSSEIDLIGAALVKRDIAEKDYADPREFVSALASGEAMWSCSQNSLKAKGACQAVSAAANNTTATGASMTDAMRQVNVWECLESVALLNNTSDPQPSAFSIRPTIGSFIETLEMKRDKHLAADPAGADEANFKEYIETIKTLYELTELEFYLKIYEGDLLTRALEWRLGSGPESWPPVPVPISEPESHRNILTLFTKTLAPTLTKHSGTDDSQLRYLEEVNTRAADALGKIKQGSETLSEDGHIV